VGKGGNRRNDLTHHTKSNLENVQSKATYPLRVHQFTTQQVGKTGKKKKKFHSSQKKSNLEYAQKCMVIQKYLLPESTPDHNTASGQRR